MLEAPKDRKVLSMERACKTHPPRSQESDKDVSHQAQQMFLPFSIEDSVFISWAPGFSFSGLPPDCIRYSLRPVHFSGSQFRIDARSAGCAFQ